VIKKYNLFLCCMVLLFSTANLVGAYPKSTDVVEELSKQLIREIEAKAKWRLVTSRSGGKQYKKIPWKPGDRQTVAVYLFREEGTNKALPFGALLEKQLAQAMDSSSKFMYVMRNMNKFYDMKKHETDFMINDETVASVGRVLGARYFLTGSYWQNGSETIIQAALWDAETGTAFHTQGKINGWELPLVKKRMLSNWWKGLIGILSLLTLFGIMRVLSRSVLYDLRAKESRTVYGLIQLGFSVVALFMGYIFAVWWFFPK
jgi:TolB-like protein